MAGPQYPPPPGEWRPPGAGGPPYGGWQPPPGWGPGGQPPHRRTEPFAIVSLVASLAGTAFCLVGPIVGIVFGHLARSRVKRSGDDGSGLALAGLIVGYVQVALLAGVVVILVLVFTLSSTDASPTAQRLGHQIQVVADEQAVSPRRGDVIRLAMRSAGLDGAQVDVGASGEAADAATDADLAASGWRLQVHTGVRAYACLTVPATTASPPSVDEGHCPYFVPDPTL